MGILLDACARRTAAKGQGPGNRVRSLDVTLIGRSSPRRRIPLPGGGSITLAWGVSTDVGLRRRVNEDSAISAPPVFAVADGMGGHSAGDRASDAVVTRLGQSLRGSFSTPSAVDQALLRAAQDIGEFAAQSPLGAGTTVTGAVLALAGADPVFVVFNVGDSRTYRFHDGELRQVTRDHSVVQELVDAGSITVAEAEHHPDSNVITRAVGFNERPLPDFWGVQPVQGLRLLICSDGLTKELRPEAIAELLGGGASARVTARLLVQAALESGGRDNVTALVVDVLALDQPER